MLTTSLQATHYDANGAPYAGWMITFALTLSAALLAVSTAYLPEGGRHAIMALFSGVCHQIPNRSPHLNGIQLAVCHRCMGIYWAIPVAALLFRLAKGRWPFRGRVALLILMFSIVPAVIDWAGDILGVWINTPISRLATGSVFGLTAGYYLAKAVGDIVRGRRGGATRGGRNHHESDPFSETEPG